MSPIFSGVRLPLSFKVLSVTVAVLCAMSVLFLFIFVGIYERRLINDHTNASTEINALLAVSLENAMLKRDISGLREIVRKLGEQPGIGGVYLLDPAREIRFAHRSELVGRNFTTADADSQANRRDVTTTFLASGFGSDGAVLRSTNPISNKLACEACHGPTSDNPINGYLVIDYKADGIAKSARRTALTLALFGGVVVLLAIVAISWALRRLVVKPLARMGEASLAIAAGDLSARTSVKGDDEIGWLGSSFDKMAGELQARRHRLQQHRAFIQSIIDAIPDGIRVVGPDYRIHMVNKAYCDQQQTTAEAALRQPCYRSSHALNEPCEASLVTCPLFEFRNGHKSALKCRHRHITSAGQERFVEVYAGKLTHGPDGEPGEFFVESIRSLAEQVVFSTQHRLSEIGYLATGVAHEIHNPLTSIGLAIRAISVELADTDQYAKTNPYLQIVKEEIGRCVDITQRLMTLSRPSDGQRVLLDLAEVVDEVLSLLNYQAHDIGIEATVSAEPDVRVLAARSDLHMLVLNLLQNAFHAMPKGGKLAVSLTRTAKKVTLSVADTGCGIAPENVSKVFWPFWSLRADHSAGTGLGLALCKSIVEQLGGTIGVTSAVGMGSVFHVDFPSADQAGKHD